MPSKMVKILAVAAVYAAQRPAGPPVSARIQHAPSEMNVGSGQPGSGFDRGTNARPVGTHAPRGSPSAACSSAGTSEVHSHADLRLSRRPRYPAARVRRYRAARGPGDPERQYSPGWPLSCRHGSATGRTGRIPPMPACWFPDGRLRGQRFMPCLRRASAACRCVPPRCPVRSPPARQRPPPAAPPSASSRPGCQSSVWPGISRA